MSQNEKLCDSRIRILIKNTFTAKENGWVKEDEEGPLKLQDLHQKVRREQQEGYYEDEYGYEYEKQVKQKPKKEEKKAKTGANYFGNFPNFNLYRHG